MRIDHVAAHINCSASKISRIETGQTGANPRDVRDMLMLYRVGEAEQESLMEIAKGSRQRGWWQSYGSMLTGAYVGFEAAAQLIRCYEAQCIPGLLQTEEYAHCLISSGRGDLSPDEISGRVRLRMARQALLTQDEPVAFWCVLDEAALRRPVGGAEVMARQLDRLLVVANASHVTLQVLPLEVGAHPGMEGSFVLLRFPDEADPDTVYVTTATGGVFQEKPHEVARYSLIFNRLQELALAPGKSAELVANMAKESQNS